jgi:hypothetical protein
VSVLVEWSCSAAPCPNLAEFVPENQVRDVLNRERDMARFVGRCSSDGYPLQDVGTFENPTATMCSNPWHPYHPGACPKCGSRANHQVAGMGMAEAECAACYHQWVPAVPQSP